MSGVLGRWPRHWHCAWSDPQLCLHQNYLQWRIQGNNSYPSINQYCGDLAPSFYLVKARMISLRRRYGLRFLPVPYWTYDCLKSYQNWIVFLLSKNYLLKNCFVSCRIFEIWYRLPVFSFRAKSRRLDTGYGFLIFYRKCENNICLIKTNDFKACSRFIFLCKSFGYFCLQPVLIFDIYGYRLIDWWLPAGDDQLIILDEADSMTNDAQNALRRIMEKFTENVRFCLIGNYLSKIIPALQSRSFKPFRSFCETKSLRKKCFWGLRIFRKNWLLPYRTYLVGNEYVKFIHTDDHSILYSFAVPLPSYWNFAYAGVA